VGKSQTSTRGSATLHWRDMGRWTSPVVQNGVVPRRGEGVAPLDSGVPWIAKRSKGTRDTGPSSSPTSARQGRADGLIGAAAVCLQWTDGAPSQSVCSSQSQVQSPCTWWGGQKASLHQETRAGEKRNVLAAARGGRQARCRPMRRLRRVFQRVVLPTLA